jgi:hypothetical protein
MKIVRVHHTFRSYVKCFPYNQKEVRHQWAALPNSTLDRERGGDFPVEVDNCLRTFKK